jgi:hypothetical protein
MKNLEKNSLIQLLDIIPDKPAQRLLHFCDENDVLSDILASYTQEKTYEYQLLCCNSSSFEANKSKYAEQSHISLLKFPLQRPRYVIQGRDYEFVFVSIAIAKEERSDFLKKTYELIKHAGNILIFLPKNDHTQRYDWLALLEEQLYVATSTIDDMFEDYDVLISRRMHGWGSK